MATHNSYKGGKVYVSSTAQNADLNLAAFEALTWTEIKDIVSQPGGAVAYNAVKQTHISPGVEQTASGAAVVTGGDLVCNNIPDDPGQVILVALAGTKNNRAFKMERSATLTAGTIVTETVYTRGVVLSIGDTGGGVDDVVNSTFTLAFNQIPIFDLP